MSAEWLSRVEAKLIKLSESVGEIDRMEERLFWKIVTGAISLAFVFLR